MSTGRSWQVLQRGWLSANNILLHGQPDEGAVLVDSGHSVHAAQTEALVRHALHGQGLRLVVNTHLHSDHCGGNARLQDGLDAAVCVPAELMAAVNAWDLSILSYEAAGQRCERFTAQQGLQPGDMVEAGSHRWLAVAAPGHDPDTLMLFNERDGVLLSADALWEDGFGVVFPELDGQDAFGAVRATLALIEQLAPRLVVPGHGRPFTEVAAALARARSRLDAFVADPRRHARHAAKALLKYHQMEVGAEPEAGTRGWLLGAPVMQACWRAEATGLSPQAWAEALIEQACRQGLMQRHEGLLHDLPMPA